MNKTKNPIIIIINLINFLVYFNKSTTTKTNFLLFLTSILITGHISEILTRPN